MKPNLCLQYVHSKTIGYGRLGVYLAEALQELGVDVYDGLESPRGTSDDRTYKQGGHSNVVSWVSVPTHARGWWKGQYAVMFTMWEATFLPESFRETMHAFDLIVVPSDHNQELFSQYHDNVKTVYLGVDPEQWNFVPRTAPTRDFNFLIAGSGKRKGTDLAYRAFRKLWPTEGSWGSGPIPHLIMKNPRGEQFYGPRIEVIGGRIPAPQEVDLYARSHCYLQPSRGEGFGLQPLQALAQGLPTILTNAHGHTSFAHLGHGLDATYSQSQYFIYGDAGDWWEPSFDQLCEYMEYVYSNYDVACAKAADAASVIAERFTWKNVAQNFIDAIGPERLTQEFTGPYEWYEPDLKRYLVVTNKDWAADIGGTHFQFRQGQHYWEKSDVKRILFEADLLDPVCIQTTRPSETTLDGVRTEWDTQYDTGLTEDQLKKVPDYSAAHSSCQLCGQKLGSKPTRADEIFAELQNGRTS